MFYNIKLRKEIEDRIIVLLTSYTDAYQTAVDLDLQPWHFNDERNQIIYEALVNIYNENKVFTSTWLKVEMQNNFRRFNILIDDMPFNNIESEWYLIDLKEKYFIISNSVDLYYYIFQLKEFVLWDYWKTLPFRNDNFSSIGKDVFEFGDNVINGYNSLLNEITNKLKKKEIHYKTELEILVNNYRNNIKVFIETGIKHYDKIYDGVYPTDLIIIAARPSMGKSLLGKALSLKMSNKGAGCFITLEVSKSKVKSQLISAQTGINYNRIKKGDLTDYEVEQILLNSELLDKSNLQIFDVTDGLKSIEQIKIKFELLYNQGLFKWAVIDYLQLIKSKQKHGTRDLEIGYITSTLKELAVKYNIPIIALAQLGRSVEFRVPPIPKLSDLRESGNIEQDADDVYFLFREGYYKKQANPGIEIPNDELFNTTLIVAKKREGELSDMNFIIDINSLKVK